MPRPCRRIAAALMGAMFALACAAAPAAEDREAPSAKPDAKTERAEPAEPEKPWSPPTFSERRADRDRMVRVIRDAYGLKDAKVLKAMASVPRHAFVPPAQSRRAYDDSPLPIGYGQTISQPYMVAEMTRLLHLEADDRVLEIGTGSAYQSAVLAHFTRHVRTIEIVRPLSEPRPQGSGRTAARHRPWHG